MNNHTTEKKINQFSPIKDIQDLEKLALLGKQIATIAHELNNPLSAIIGYAEMLQAMDLDSRAKKYAHNIYVSSMRASKIAESLLTFLRKKDIKLVAIDINEVISKTLAIFEYQLNTNDISVEVDLRATHTMLGDFHKLQQIFFNLIINSIQSLENWEGTRKISIHTKSSANTISIIFSDSGAGIAKEEAEKIFLPLHTTKKNGTGLGLSIVQGLVQEHDGKIKLLNDLMGCTFELIFPTSAEIQYDKVSTDTLRSKISSKRILIIDDDEMVVHAIVGIIRLLGCSVTFMTKPYEALEEVKRNIYDKILVDYKMPILNGVEFIKLASEFVDLKKFVLITGYVGLNIEEKMQSCKIPVLHKPIGLEEIRKIVSE
ncbi:MAG: ATP-binding protein [Thermodesulfovibrionales bacterium]|nr:ATP-binding protein [Thermodesulfovibrionales bacterium]